MVGNATEYLKNIVGAADHSYTFLHSSWLDFAGHGKGFCGKEYLEAVDLVDKWVGQLLDAVNDDDGNEWMVSCEKSRYRNLLLHREFKS